MTLLLVEISSEDIMGKVKCKYIRRQVMNCRNKQQNSLIDRIHRAGTTPFPLLGQEKPTDAKKYEEETHLQQQEFSFHYQDMRI
jgi:hypothetical protein